MPQVAIDSIELSNKVDIGLYTISVLIYSGYVNKMLVPFLIGLRLVYQRYYTLVSYPIGNTMVLVH